MVRYVKSHQVIAAIYLTKRSEKNKSTTLKLPSNTRWGGVVIMFDSLLEGKESPRNGHITVCRYGQPHQEDPPGLCILGESVVSSLKLLKPIALAIARIEGDIAILSDVETLLADV